MHYANGRPAKNGDKVVLLGYGGPVVGILYDATAGNDFCNGKIAVTKPNDPCPNLRECLHVDDVLALLPAQEGVLADSHPSLFNRIPLVPDTSVVPDKSQAPEPIGSSNAGHSRALANES
jgi:hypothetical protein